MIFETDLSARMLAPVIVKSNPTGKQYDILGATLTYSIGSDAKSFRVYKTKKGEILAMISVGHYFVNVEEYDFTLVKIGHFAKAKSLVNFETFDFSKFKIPERKRSQDYEHGLIRRVRSVACS
jgi:hypothetical protein